MCCVVNGDKGCVLLFLVIFILFIMLLFVVLRFGILKMLCSGKLVEFICGIFILLGIVKCIGMGVLE